MKKYGKIIIAFMWLGLTMIMIVGATFAWFAENRNVQAGGMQVQAETVKNLLIKNNDANGTYAVSATSTLTEVQELAPASTATALTDGAFFAAVDATRSNGYINAVSGQITGTPSMDAPFRAAHVAATNADAATFKSAQSEKHVEVAKHEFLVKTDGTNTTLGKLYLSGLTVTPATATSAISAALRVAVVCGTGNGAHAYIFAPVTATVGVEPNTTNVAPTTSYKGITANAGTLSESNVAISSIPASSWLDNNGTPLYELASSVSTTATTVYVYVWYEGQDLNCTSANSANVEQLTVSVQFSALEASN